MSEAKQAINLSRANGQTAISLFYLPIALPYSAGLNAHVYEVLTMVYKDEILSEGAFSFSFSIFYFFMRNKCLWWFILNSKNLKLKLKKTPENVGVWN